MQTLFYPAACGLIPLFIYTTACGLRPCSPVYIKKAKRIEGRSPSIRCWLDFPLDPIPIVLAFDNLLPFIYHSRKPLHPLR